MKVKTHLITKDQYDEYTVKWHGRLIDTKPELKNGMPVWVLQRTSGRMEINSIDLKYIETMAKKFTRPRGRGSLTSDRTLIYIKELDGKEKHVATVIHNHIRKYAPMYDEL